ncbi:MAG: phosphoadenylyl-sulfate reductase [Anaerolineae bacterium]|jgi:phosphoadenosine phosphosulfate reductase|nr:phosphoadenylyl-sulfate reductase [Anaerolineae bacterium]MBT4310491.1 phosphoadenylyl-sulfate reductase [Anaerolineae bacterium]MBT6061033.1 phosphoadenylyl-sulfate reductase [Anaerolineae bacterium]MBT6320885.1 phosphoadenylyl-sulfate reductase [Anaerolineae bacterium]MBT6812420.1 phosphoadenylyl-sulfate reductase [Anaerolineae bacterium]
MKFTPQEIESLSKDFESASPQEIIAWAVAHFCPNLVLSSSFQTQSLPLLHMVWQAHPQMRIFFLDTGLHFWDTLIFREKLQQKWDLNIVDLRPEEKWRTVLRHFGSDLPETDPNLCCYIRKVQPMQKAMEGLDAWITGIRREQTENRAHAQILEYKRDGLLRIAPLLNWTGEEVFNYISANNLPRHPLPASRYPSIGCKPCTRAIQVGENERAGRWDGKGKTECGLHTEMFNKDKLTDEFYL